MEYITRPEWIKQWMWDYALECIQDYNMDNSHGIQHFNDTAVWVRLILKEFKNVVVINGLDKKTEEEVLIDAGFVHDLIDSKYINETLGLAKLEAVCDHNLYPHFDLIKKIITNISFSKRIARAKRGLDMIEDNELHLATAIIVDADQLDGYSVERCRIYQETKINKLSHPHLTDIEIEVLRKGWRKTILVNRVLLYKDVYMNTKTGKNLAELLHNSVIDHVSNELEDAEIFDYGM